MVLVKKAVLLAAGEGKRLLPLTATRPKHLISAAGKPLIQYTLEYLKKVGVEEVLLVVGYKEEQFKEYFKDGSQLGLKIEYITQRKYLGTADAAKISQDFAGTDPFFLIYGDLLIDSRVFEIVSQIYNQRGRNNSTTSNEMVQKENQTANGIICVFKVPDPNKYGIINVDQDKYVKSIVEKPPDGRFGNLANAGVFIFDEKIFDAINKTPKSARNEYELTDSMQIYCDNGNKLLALDISEYYWSDVGHPWQLLDANKYLLDELNKKHKGNIVNDGCIEEGVVIKGFAYVGEGSDIYAGTRIEGPVFIGKNSTIGPNSYIRPYSSIGPNTRIGNSSELKNTIILGNSNMSHLSYCGDSLIGSGVNLGAGTVLSNVRLDKKEVFMNVKGKRVGTGKKKMGAVIGDNVQLGINVMVMTGKTIGNNSAVGAGTIIIDDVRPNTLIYTKQEQIVKELKKRCGE